MRRPPKGPWSDRLRSILAYAAAAALGFGAWTLAAPGTPAAGQEAAPEAEAAALAADVDFLREKLLKIWVIEEASDRHNQRRIAEKSFTGMTPFEPTGDPELDRANREAYLKNDKHLRHYLLLELDNAIEAVDICKRVLGLHLKPPVGDRALRAFLEQELPAIKWHDKPLEAAFQDLGRKINVPVKFSGIGEREDVRISLELDPGFQLQHALDFIRSYHPFAWRYEDGTLIVEYQGS